MLLIISHIENERGRTLRCAMKGAGPCDVRSMKGAGPCDVRSMRKLREVSPFFVGASKISLDRDHQQRLFDPHGVGKIERDGGLRPKFECSST